MRPIAQSLACAAGLATAVATTSASTDSGRAFSLPTRLVHDELAPFGGTRLGISPIEGSIELAGRRVHTWTEHAVVGANPTTTRLLLTDDVRVNLAGQYFEASKAAVWIQKISDDQYQVYACLENARTASSTAGIATRSSFLPVEAVISTGEPIRLGADARLQGPPAKDEAADFLKEADASFAGAMTRIEHPEQIKRPEPIAGLPLGSYPADAPVPDRSPKPAPELREPDRRVVVTPQEEVIEHRQRDKDQQQALNEPTKRQPRVEPPLPAPGGLFDPTGVFFLSAGDQIVVSPAGSENTLQLSGGVVVQYVGSEGNLELTAQRAVVFLRGGKLTDLVSRFSAEDVLGIYLEGDVVATDGDYTLRGPRVYYDVANERALIVDAVFWTWDDRTSMPLYLRADAVRQEASNQFSAEKAVFSNSAFFTPHLALGAKDITISRETDEQTGKEHNVVDAKGITFRGADVPFFYLPGFRGDPERIPLRNIGFKDSNRQGSAITTEWDVFTILGIRPPEGLDATVSIDFYSDRGMGFGTNLDWDTPEHKGELLAYILPEDNGSDITGAGREIDQDGDTRGLLLLNERWQITPDWTLIGELGYLSDPLLTQDLFEDVGVFTPNEITNRLHLRRLDEHSMLTLEAKAASNDFLANEFQLQAPGYAVDKLPEIEYWNLASDLAPEWSPGFLTHTWEASVSSMRMRFSEVSLDEQGFTRAGARRAFGITDTTQSLGDVLRGQGLDESIVNRFDTRQELSAAFDAGPLRINPFIVGRFTAYDDNFQAYSPIEDENVRSWGAAGVRFSTSISRVDNGVDSRVFDLHRVRHIIEPSLTLWHAESTVERQELPVYDDDVESLAEGSMARLGIDQTWQTKRGGVGRWRTVDVLKLNLGYVWAGDEEERGTPIGRWYDPRPELGTPQQFAHAEFVWQTSEVVALTGELTYDPFDNAMDRASVGVIFDRGRGFDARAELRRIESQDSTFADVALGYLFSEKYQLDLISQYDFTREKFSTVTGTLLRGFPYGQLGLVLQYDNIRDTTSFGFVFRPRGAMGGLSVGGDRNRDSGFGG